MKMPAGLLDNADALLASTASVGTTLSLAATQPIDPANPWSALSYLPALFGPMLIVFVNRHFAGRAARKRARAAFLRDEAARIENDHDPKNDAEARQKRLEAAELEAEAEALQHPNVR